MFVVYFYFKEKKWFWKYLKFPATRPYKPDF